MNNIYEEPLKRWQTDILIDKNLNPPVNDPVNHPSHYTDGKIEVIDFIEDKKLGFHLGNAVKYISRAGKKDPAKTIEDLKKAIWYIQRQIDVLNNEKQMETVAKGYPPVAVEPTKWLTEDGCTTVAEKVEHGSER